MKLYRSILGQSWQATIHHPSRWVFGLFAALLVGNGGEIDRYLRYVDAFEQRAGIINLLFWSQQPWFQTLQRILPQMNPQILFGIAAVTILLIIYMVTISQGSLIASTTVPALQKVVFYEAYSKGQKHVLSLLMLNVSSYLIIGLTLLGCGMLLNTYEGLLGLSLAALILLPVILVVSFVSRYAANFIVLENKHLAVALLQGWKLLWKYFSKTMLMALVMFGLAVIINLGVVLAIGIVIAPFFSSLPLELYTINTIGIIIYTVAAVIIGAIVSTWQWTAWTLWFKSLTKLL